MGNNQEQISNTYVSAQSQMPASNSKKSPSWLVATAVVCGMLAIAGTAFGVYELIDSNQKSEQLSNLKADINNKDEKINELETQISELTVDKTEIDIDSDVAIDEPESTPAQETQPNDGTAVVVLGSILDENDSRIVYRVGECSADGSASTNISIKCRTTINGKEGLVSSNTSDGIIRLVIPKN